MSRKNKKKKGARQEEVVVQPANYGNPYGNPYVFQGPVSGAYPFPVAPASPIVQLPPIVQPIVMVPLTSQQQPIASYYEEEDDDDFDF